MSAKNTERNKTIYELRKKGSTLEAVARKYGISKERVRQIYVIEERNKQRVAKCEWYSPELDMRTINALQRAFGEISREEFLALDEETLMEKYNLGYQRVAKIMEVQERMRAES